MVWPPCTRLPSSSHLTQQYSVPKRPWLPLPCKTLGCFHRRASARAAHSASRLPKPQGLCPGEWGPLCKEGHGLEAPCPACGCRDELSHLDLPHPPALEESGGADGLLPRKEPEVSPSSGLDWALTQACVTVHLTESIHFPCLSHLPPTPGDPSLRAHTCGRSHLLHFANPVTLTQTAFSLSLFILT